MAKRKHTSAKSSSGDLSDTDSAKRRRFTPSTTPDDPSGVGNAEPILQSSVLPSSSRIATHEDNKAEGATPANTPQHTDAAAKNSSTKDATQPQASSSSADSDSESLWSYHSTPLTPNWGEYMYDHTFGKQVCEHYEERSKREAFRFQLRVKSYGREIAEEFRAGFTPETVRQEWEARRDREMIEAEKEAKRAWEEGPDTPFSDAEPYPPKGHIPWSSDLWWGYSNLEKSSQEEKVD